MNIAMLRNALFVGAAVFALGAAAAPVHAQDRLEPLAKKAKLDRRDRAAIAAEVAERARRLAQAGAEAEARSRARANLVKTAGTPGASREFLAAYAEVCAKELQPLAAGAVFETGLDAVGVLVDLDDPRTAEALAAAFKSSHAPIRLRAARGLHLLQKRLAADDRTCQTILRELGEAGAAERDEIVLGVLYQAVDFGAELKSDRLAEGCARAVNAILAGRLRRLREGDRNEPADEPAIALAARCFRAVSEEQQKQLLANLTAYLGHCVDRYFAADTAERYLPVLADLVKKIEAAIHGMMKGSKGKPPNDTVDSAIRKAREPKKEQAARAALGNLKTALQGEPWNLTFESAGPG